VLYGDFGLSRSLRVAGQKEQFTRFVPGRIASFRFALRGIRLLLRTQTNARIHAAATLLVVTLGCWQGVTAAQWGLLAVAITLVWLAETLNTAIERLTDLVSPEFRPLAGEVKDLAAAAVLLSALGAVAVACAVFGPSLLH